MSQSKFRRVSRNAVMIIVIINFVCALYCVAVGEWLLALIFAGSAAIGPIAMEAIEWADKP